MALDMKSTEKTNVSFLFDRVLSAVEIAAYKLFSSIQEKHIRKKLIIMLLDRMKNSIDKSKANVYPRNPLTVMKFTK
jgi:hypothetical protein